MMTSLLKRALPFAITLVVGTGFGSLFGANDVARKTDSARKSSARWRARSQSQGGVSRASSTPVLIKFKPEATYTEAASGAGASGIVRLGVEFRDNGTIGEIETLDGMPYGLTEEAHEAAKGIAFVPAIINGTPTTTTRVVEFAFQNRGRNLITIDE